MKDPDYYNREDKAKEISANSLAYAQIVGIPVVLVIGFLYDILGRKAMTVSAFVLGALSTIAVPLVSPSIVGFDCARVIFVQTMVIMLSNPFINDYVTVQSRGIATGFQTIGLTVGNLVSVGGMFTLTEKINNKVISYGILGALQLVWAVLVFFMISEPVILNEKEERH